MTMGPNNVRHIVWALGECFSFFILHFFYISFIVIYRYYNARNLQKSSLKVRKGVWKATTRITGPNNVSHVIWTLGECFFILFPSYFNGFYRLPLVLGVKVTTTGCTIILVPRLETQMSWAPGMFLFFFCLFYFFYSLYEHLGPKKNPNDCLYRCLGFSEFLLIYCHVFLTY